MRESFEIISPRLGPTSRIYETLITMHEKGETINFATVHERLPSAQQELLQSIVLESTDSGATLEEGLECISIWCRKSQMESQGDLKAQIKQAEREGRLEDALRLMQQLGRAPNPEGIM